MGSNHPPTLSLCLRYLHTVTLTSGTPVRQAPPACSVGFDPLPTPTTLPLLFVSLAT